MVQYNINNDDFAHHHNKIITFWERVWEQLD
jgi:hypothetical protein